MPDPNFSVPERRSLIFPVLGGLLALSAAAALAVHFFPATTVNIEHVHADILATATTFKVNSIVVGHDPVEHTLFVAETVRLDDQLHVPIYLDDFTCTFTEPSGAVMTVTAAQKPDLPNIETSFPALVPLLRNPLLRETRIDPGHTLEGTVLLTFPFTEAQWKARKSAVLTVALYHQQTLYQTIP